MSPFLDRLRSGLTLLLDGGLGSMILARGLSRGQAPESWNEARPDEVTAVHRAYVEAGSDAVQTNTFGGHPARLARAGLLDRCEAIQAAAVRLARAASPRFVIGDLGPSGEYLPPVGRADAAEWRSGFERQGRALAEAGPDALHVETMSDLREARVALASLKAVAPHLPVLVSMTFERKKRGFFTVMGDPLVASLKALVEAGADAVGANCTLASPDLRDLAAEARATLSVPLVVQPNAGQPQPTVEGGVRYAQDPERFAEDMAAVAALGVAAVGGCCGTDPRFIQALRRRLG
ncbi:MAG TPA: homocysteine S-methyltransferase family protein [Vicinamibacteria bacterium]|nr:homocysteine S-methyltransferase family protein [Vicinamibacteria bacterium]